MGTPIEALKQIYAGKEEQLEALLAKLNKDFAETTITKTQCSCGKVPCDCGARLDASNAPQARETPSRTSKRTTAIVSPELSPKELTEIDAETPVTQTSQITPEQLQEAIKIAKENGIAIDTEKIKALSQNFQKDVSEKILTLLEDNKTELSINADNRIDDKKPDDTHANQATLLAQSQESVQISHQTPTSVVVVEAPLPSNINLQRDSAHSPKAVSQVEPLQNTLVVESAPSRIGTEINREITEQALADNQAITENKEVVITKPFESHIQDTAASKNLVSNIQDPLILQIVNSIKSDPIPEPSRPVLNLAISKKTPETTSKLKVIKNVLTAETTKAPRRPEPSGQTIRSENQTQAGLKKSAHAIRIEASAVKTVSAIVQTVPMPIEHQVRISQKLIAQIVSSIAAINTNQRLENFSLSIKRSSFTATAPNTVKN